MNHLTKLSVMDLKAKFLQNQDSLEALQRINNVLKVRNTDDANELQLIIVQAMQRLGKERSASSMDAVKSWILSYLLRRNLSVPTGRELYRYQMSDQEYGEALKALQQSGLDRLLKTDRHISAVFCAFSAEWFRRESQGAFHVWNRIAPDVLTPLPDATKRELTETGLSFWGRKVRKSGGNREFLLSLALEGGFPIKVLRDSNTGWLKSFLGTVMRRCLAYSGISREEIEQIAREESPALVSSYRNDEFLNICSELVESVLHWKTRIDSVELGNMDPVTYLDIHHSDWRKDIPLYLPAGDRDLANEILSGLLKEKAGRLASDGIGCERYLIEVDGQWQPALHILADGELSAQKLNRLNPSAGRLHVIPTGVLAECLLRSFALIEPPTSSNSTWRVRPIVRFSEPLCPFPFDHPVNVNLTSAANPIHMTWPKGEAIRSQLLVFSPSADGKPGSRRLKLIGQGSTRSPHDYLMALMPSNWRTETLDGNTNEMSEDVPFCSAKLVRIVARTYIIDPTDELNPFLIEPQTDALDAKVVIRAQQPERLEADCELYYFPISLEIVEKGISRVPHSGEMMWRRLGESWKDFLAHRIEEGVVDLSWRDTASGIQLDRLRVYVLPRGAKLVGRMTATNLAEIKFQGFVGWKFNCDVANIKPSDTTQGLLSVTFSEKPSYRLPCELIPFKGARLSLSVFLGGYQPFLASADGMIVPEGQRLDLSFLRGAVAISPGPSEIFLDLKTRKQIRTAFAMLRVDGELALASFRSIAEEFFASTDEQDAIIDISFAGSSDRPFKLSRYRRAEVVIRDGLLLETLD